MRRRPQWRPLVVLDASGYLSRDTIVAPISGVGGAVCALRISGPRAKEILVNLSGKQEWEPRLASRVLIRAQSGRLLDDAVAIYFEDGASFTGEKTAEIFLHGGKWGVSTVLSEIYSQGARTALPGEFSFRSVRNGKMTVFQAQGVADLIAAQSDLAQDLALKKVSLRQSASLEELGERLRHLCAFGELGIDFMDQDVEELELSALKQQAKEVLQILIQLETSFEKGRRVQEGVSVAILGLPNAGKSSLFNALLGEDRAIVSDQAGTTRDLIRESIVVQAKSTSLLLRFVDTAGLRTTADRVEKEGILRARKAGVEADVVIWVLSRESSAQEVEQWLQIRDGIALQANQHEIFVQTKADLPMNQAQGHRQVEQNWLHVSSTTGLGISALVEEIAAYAEELLVSPQEDIVLTREEQVFSVRKASEDIRRGIQANDAALFAADMRAALVSLAPLIGGTPTDDILGRIFSQFCIGK